MVQKRPLSLKHRGRSRRGSRTGSRLREPRSGSQLPGRRRRNRILPGEGRGGRFGMRREEEELERQEGCFPAQLPVEVTQTGNSPPGAAQERSRRAGATLGGGGRAEPSGAPGRAEQSGRRGPSRRRAAPFPGAGGERVSSASPGPERPARGVGPSLRRRLRRFGCGFAPLPRFLQRLHPTCRAVPRPPRPSRCWPRPPHADFRFIHSPALFLVLPLASRLRPAELPRAAGLEGAPAGWVEPGAAAAGKGRADLSGEPRR